MRGLRIISHGPNNDGCNPESCRDVFIENTYFDTGDDCIAIKSGRNADGRRLNTPSENIVVRNCRMKHGHGGLTIGSEMSGDVRSGRSDYAFYLRAFEHAPLEGVRVARCRFDHVARGNVIEHVRDVALEQVLLNGRRVDVL